MKPPPRLHVNVDHVATVREARKISEPDPTRWALEAEAAGADGITCHLRQDRRHIADHDVRLLRERIGTLLNLECSLNPEMVKIALESRADEICLVPENRAEVTTEGGLDVVQHSERLAEVMPRFQELGMQVSLFIDPRPEQIEASAKLKADFIELHTGAYSNVQGAKREGELEQLVKAAEQAHGLGLQVNAGHGLNYENLGPVARLPHLKELNIGHAIVAHSLFVGVRAAIQEMQQLILAAQA